MRQFEDYIFEKFKNCILSFDEELTIDIYCLEVFHGGQDFCQSDFALTYNTKSHLQERMKHVGESAKWDFAEWTCAYPTGVPEDIGDKELWTRELQLWEEWCRQNHIPTDEDLTKYCGKHLYQAQPLYSASRTLARNIAARLHKEGVVLKKFGRLIPVYITHNDGFFDSPGIFEANPPQAVEEFKKEASDYGMPEWAQ